MKTIASSLDHIISTHPFIEEALLNQVINYSALAKRLNTEVNNYLKRQVKPEAIMMALRRYKLPHAVQQTQKLKQALEQIGAITVRSNLSDYAFKNSETLVKHNALVLKHIQHKTNSFYAFTRGIHESNLVISNTEQKLIETHFSNEELISKQENLSAISLELPKNSWQISGLYYTLFKRLAWQNIPVYEVVSTTNEFTILVEDQFVDSAFSVLKHVKL